MQRLSEADPIYLELYEAITHFRGRQQLVLRAIAEQGVEVKDLARGTGGWQGKTPQKGEWGEAWHFLFHGAGCRLTHNETDEPVDFNGSDPQAFGSLSFIAHLEWRLDYDPNVLPLLRSFVESRGKYALLNLIDELVGFGVVTSDNHLSIPFEATLGHTV